MATCDYTVGKISGSTVEDYRMIVNFLLEHGNESFLVLPKKLVCHALF